MLDSIRSDSIAIRKEPTKKTRKGAYNYAPLNTPIIIIIIQNDSKIYLDKSNMKLKL